MPESIKGSRLLTVARLFFLLVIIPLLLIASLIAFSIFNLGGLSKTGTMAALDQKAQQEILSSAPMKNSNMQVGKNV